MEIYSATVEPSWIDYNGHMNVAYYHMAFDRATDRFLSHIGLGEDYLAREKGTMFALEDHMVYSRELREGEPFRVVLQLLDFDEKRLHYFMRMFHAEKDYLAATCEHLSIFVDITRRRSAPMPGKTARALEDLRSEHGRIPWPDEAGRPMRIRRREE